ncbi:MAG: DUF3592 domain-containing protein [Haloechinothrix sp.]
MAAVTKARRFRIAVRVVFGVACLMTLLGAALVFAAYRNDGAITASRGEADAEVVSVGWDRTIVRFQSPGGVVHIPPNGVLYPDGLTEGQLVRVEYATGDPDLVRVAGRTATSTLLPVGTTVLVTWLIAGPLLWWLRRPAAS